MKTRFFLLVALFALVSTAVSAQDDESTPIESITKTFFQSENTVIYDVFAITSNGEILQNYANNSEPVMVACIRKNSILVTKLKTQEVLFGETIIPNLENVVVKIGETKSLRDVFKTEGGLLVNVLKSKLKGMDVYVVSFFGAEEKTEVLTLLCRNPIEL